MSVQNLILSVILDLAAAVVIIVLLVRGWKKGLIRSLGRIFSLLVALFLGKQIADWGAGYLAAALSGRLEPFVTDKLTALAAQAAAGEETSLGVLGMIPNARELLEDVTERVVDTLAPMVALELARVISWGILFLVGAVVVYLLMRLLVCLLNAVSGLPGLHLLNGLGGGVLGAIKGALIVWLVLVLLNLFGILPGEFLAQTHILRVLAGSP